MNINILYLLHILKTNSLKELVNNISASWLDINLSIWENENNGNITIGEDGDTITVNKDYIPTCDGDLSAKLLAVVRQYDMNGRCLNKARLDGYVFSEVVKEYNPRYHDYLMSIEWLVHENMIVRSEHKVGEHTYVLFTLPESKDKGYVEKFLEEVEKIHKK